jgi:hypothetical protein
MRKPEDMAWYSIAGSDGFPRAMHCVKGKQPKDAKEVSQVEAAQISKDVRAREPKPVAAVAQQAASAVPAPDLTPIKNQLEAHSKMLVEQAHALDAHETKINATQASVSAYLLGVKSGVTA